MMNRYCEENLESNSPLKIEEIIILVIPALPAWVAQGRWDQQ